MDMAVEIRTGFDEAERTRVGELYWTAFRRKLGPAFADDVTGREFITAAMRPDRLLTARVGGEVLGVCGLQYGARGAFDPAWPDTRRRLGPVATARLLLVLGVLARRPEPDTLVLDGICVSPEHRGAGIGSRLLAACTDHARRHGLRSVRLTVVDTNPRAEALYRRVGFTTVDSGSMGVLRGIYGFDGYTTLRRGVTGRGDT
ncbi:GNAT family N-acetyltransferase [Nocardiopsis sp. CC223A]|uniref:GNAT family N-acetyltransferase n=1 Tax=Nocardiopsis sp. CC223A TaxID=3044051 RepID=UPI0027956EAD|nr:GNAT family N-acetyltransferase [Nocardiopsis sp. CC223A]